MIPEKLAPIMERIKRDFPSTAEWAEVSDDVGGASIICGMMGFCACSYPEPAIQRFCYPVLSALDHEDVGAREAALEKTGLDEPTRDFVIRVLDGKGLVEHGTSIRYCWLTEAGKTTLAACDALWGRGGEE